MRVLIVGLILLLAFSVDGQVNVRVAVDTASMLIGDQVQLHVEATAAKGTVLKDPLWPPNTDTLEFLSLGKWEPLPSGTMMAKALFTVWDTGYHVIPKIGVPYQSEGLNDTAWTQNIVVQVLLPSDSLQLNDIKDIECEPATLQDYLPFLYALGTMVLVGFLVWYWRQPAKQKKQPPPVTPPLPHELALQKLAELEALKLWQRGEVKTYHSELTHIAREYLEGRFGIKALEETTQEILSQLHQQNLPADLRRLLEEILQTADMVKFAKAQPSAAFHERAFESVKIFIEQTKPVANAPAEGT